MKNLTNAFEKIGSVCKILIKRKSPKLKFREGGDLRQHIAHLEKLLIELKNASEKLDKLDKLNYLTVVLPKSFDSEIKFFDLINKKLIDSVKKKLIINYSRSEDENNEKSLSQVEACNVVRHSRNLNNCYKCIVQVISRNTIVTYIAKYYHNVSSVREQLKCFYCGRIGHVKSNCYALKNKSGNSREGNSLSGYSTERQGDQSNSIVASSNQGKKPVKMISASLASTNTCMKKEDSD